MTNLRAAQPAKAVGLALLAYAPSNRSRPMVAERNERPMSYAVKIGDGYFASDDQAAVPSPADALRLPTRERAEAEAETVRETWDVQPEEVTVVPLPA